MSRTDAPPPRLSLLLGSVLLAATASVACFYSLFLLPVAAVPLGFVGFPRPNRLRQRRGAPFAGRQWGIWRRGLSLALIALRCNPWATSLRPAFVRCSHLLHAHPRRARAGRYLSAFYTLRPQRGGLPQLSAYVAAN